MRIYFSGIGGVGIGPLAMIAHDAGYDVCGSDREAGLMTQAVAEKNIAFSLEQSGEFLRSEHEKSPFDWFVYTAGLPADHPELLLAKQLGIRTSKRDELLAHIVADKNLKLIAVAGTHGKTTVTSMLIWLAQYCSIPLSYSVGTTLSFGPSGAYAPDSEFFVYECDEFDRNFLHFEPFLSLVASIDYDHPDTYPTGQDYLTAFARFGSQSEHVIAWRDQHGEIFPDATLLDAPFSIRLAGEHNRRNASLIMAAATFLNLSQTDVARALESFPGANRRFEKLAPGIYSDYGHHPIEIAATLQMARELSPSGVVLVYQPHQNVRQHEIKSDYRDQFEHADTVYWLPTYLSREDPALPILSPQDLTRNITNRKNIVYADLNETLWHDIQAARQSGKLVLGMGAGNIDGWLREQLQRPSSD